MSSWFWAAATLLAASCNPFEAGSITRAPDGALKANAAELSCLDVVIHPIARELAESVSSIHVVYQFGNHCPETAALDFAAPVVMALLADGRHETLPPVPVAGRDLSAVIDAYARGAENITYVAPSDGDAQQAILAFCVDASRLEAGAKGVGPPACFKRLYDGVFASVDAANVDDADDRARPPGAVATIQPTSASTDDSGLTCREGSTGPRWCDRFAVWRRPPAIVATGGFSTHHFDLAQRSLFGGESFGASASYSAAPLRWLQGETFDVRGTGFVWWPLYVGAELQIGGASIGSPAVLSDSPHFGVASGWLMLGGGLVAGVESPHLGPLSAELEMYAGGAEVDLREDAASSYTDACTASDNGCDGARVASWILEPRLRAHAWLSPWISLDGWGGLGLLPWGDWSAGLAISLHGRSFDGAP